jgi:hypothetical protein
MFGSQPAEVFGTPGTNHYKAAGIRLDTSYATTVYRQPASEGVRKRAEGSGRLEIVDICGFRASLKARLQVNHGGSTGHLAQSLRLIVRGERCPM